MKSDKEVRKWFMALEAERHDTSYLNPPKERGVTEYTKIVYRDKPVDHRYRDGVMFHAGRWAAGARDLQAARANRLAAKMIGENK